MQSSAMIKAVFAAAMAREAICTVAPKNESHGHSQEWINSLEADFSARNEHLFVHIIPHSHDDVGWLKTVDEYFTGSAQSI